MKFNLSVIFQNKVKTEYYRQFRQKIGSNVYIFNISSMGILELTSIGHSYGFPFYSIIDVQKYFEIIFSKELDIIPDSLGNLFIIHTFMHKIEIKLV